MIDIFELEQKMVFCAQTARQQSFRLELKSISWAEKNAKPLRLCGNFERRERNKQFEIAHKNWITIVGVMELEERKWKRNVYGLYFGGERETNGSLM